MGAGTFPRAAASKQGGKGRSYYGVVENTRVRVGRVRQRQVLHLGKINTSQRHLRRCSIEVLDEAMHGVRAFALIPEDRCEEVVPDGSIMRLTLGPLRLERRGRAAHAGPRVEAVAEPRFRWVLGRATVPPSLDFS